jgi:hypothetical protein
MKHKFYYYEYSDDGGQTWTMGDYRRYLMPIMELVRECPYPSRVLNQDDEQISEEEISETIDQMNTMERILGKDSILWEAKW